MKYTYITFTYQCTTLCDIVCQWLATSWWFFLGTPVSSTNKTDCHDMTEILLKVALNTIKQTNKLILHLLTIVSNIRFFSNGFNEFFVNLRHVISHLHQEILNFWIINIEDIYNKHWCLFIRTVKFCEHRCIFGKDCEMLSMQTYTW